MTTYQAALFGGEEVAGDIPDRCRAMLFEEPDTRRNYGWAYIRYLVRYHGLRLDQTVGELAEMIKAETVPAFRTVANRCQELITARAELQPPAEVMRRRQEQRFQGRVRR